MSFKKDIYFTIFIFLVIFFLIFPLKAEEESSDVRSELQRISADLKTLEKALYKTSEIQTSKISPNSLNIEKQIAARKNRIHPKGTQNRRHVSPVKYRVEF